MKRLIYSLTLVLTLVFTFNFFVNVEAATNSSNSYANENAAYRVDSVEDDYDLGYGIQYHRDISYLKTTNASAKTGGSAGSNGGVWELNTEYRNQVNVLEIAPSQEVELVPYAVLEGSAWNASSVRNAAADYEKNHAGYKVIAAINGDYFQIGQEYPASTGVTIGQGEYYKATSNHSYQAVNTLAIKNSGSGKQLFSTKLTDVAPTLTIYDENGAEIKKVTVNKINEEPGVGEISVFYSTREKNFEKPYINVSVQNAWLVSTPSCAVTSMQGSFYGKGEITSFSTDSYDLNLGKFAIKTNKSEIDSLLEQGVTVRCQYEYTDPSLNGIDNFIGYAFHILENGKLNNVDNNRHPRTMIGQKADGTMVLAVIDGRQLAKEMHGASCSEMGALMAYYGCVDAWNLDGGGSSTMIIRKQSDINYTNGYWDTLSNDWWVTNSPSDQTSDTNKANWYNPNVNSERHDGNCLLVVVKVPVIDLEIEDITDKDVTFALNFKSGEEMYEKYAIKHNGEVIEAVDGKIKIDGLKDKIMYDLQLYGMKDGKYYHLGYRKLIENATPLPKDVKVSLSMTEINGKKAVQLNYRIDNKTCVSSIFVIIGEDKYSTSLLSVSIEQSRDLYDALKKLDVYLIAAPSNLIDNKELVFENVKLSCTFDFAFEELKFETNDMYKGIFD